MEIALFLFTFALRQKQQEKYHSRIRSKGIMSKNIAVSF